MKFYLIISFVFLFATTNKSLAQSGCTDVLAKNFNLNAIENDGSCKYKKLKLKEFKSVVLNDTLRETSGLIEWENHLYTHNDDTDLHLYQLNKEGVILKSILLTGIKNKDCEDLTQDENYIYLGDFGNNAKGNRTDLTIYKIAKDSLFESPKIEIITFAYRDQTDFSKQNKNSTNFDCEAMIATENELILFTKQWNSKQTSVYRLPKNPGNYSAEYITTLKIQGLITGATFVEEKNLIALCGHNKKLKPFVFLITDLNDFNFNKANQRKIQLKLPFHQIEAISSTNGIDFYLTNERFSRKIIGTIPPQLHTFSFDFLK
jgi:hypothetical protein